MIAAMGYDCSHRYQLNASSACSICPKTSKHTEKVPWIIPWDQTQIFIYKITNRNKKTFRSLIGAKKKSYYGALLYMKNDLWKFLLDEI